MSNAKSHQDTVLFLTHESTHPYCLVRLRLIVETLKALGFITTAESCERIYNGYCNTLLRLEEQLHAFKDLKRSLYIDWVKKSSTTISEIVRSICEVHDLLRGEAAHRHATLYAPFSAEKEGRLLHRWEDIVKHVIGGTSSPDWDPSDILNAIWFKRTAVLLGPAGEEEFNYKSLQEEGLAFRTALSLTLKEDQDV